jgi:EAL domain-containing protein (putative c-di-GMP-specific phosphodiesterase class I)
LTTTHSLTNDVVRPPGASPYLERYAEHGGPVERVWLVKLPFSIGRSETNDHTVYSSKVSNEHALIVRIGDRYAIRDLSSTNGTFVNGSRVTEQCLSDGDIIFLAHVEFCFRQQPVTGMRERDAMGVVERTQLVDSEPPTSVIAGRRLLREMIESEAVESVFQPIVDLATREIIGYEALGRGKHCDLDRSPAVLLQLAEQCEMVIELCQVFRRVALRSSTRLPHGAKLFLNVHGRELASLGLHGALAQVQPLAPDRRIVIEIAESSVTNVAAMARHREDMDALGFEFAYDDFGAGQARLLELCDIPPHYLKLDRTVVHGIEEAKPRQDIVEAFVKVVQAIGVKVIAEGIETEKGAEICRRLGCHHGQGYLFDPPA